LNADELSIRHVEACRSISTALIIPNQANQPDPWPLLVAGAAWFSAGRGHGGSAHAPRFGASHLAAGLKKSLRQEEMKLKGETGWNRLELVNLRSQCNSIQYNCFVAHVSTCHLCLSPLPSVFSDSLLPNPDLPKVGYGRQTAPKLKIRIAGCNRNCRLSMFVPQHKCNTSVSRCSHVHTGHTATPLPRWVSHDLLNYAVGKLVFGCFWTIGGFRVYSRRGSEHIVAVGLPNLRYRSDPNKAWAECSTTKLGNACH
jgi:hypothetical protein